MVDGVQLIIASPPARDHWNADGSAHMWRPSASYSACTFIFEAVVTRRGSRCSLHKAAASGESGRGSAVHFDQSSRAAGRCTVG